jgi:hypothetical protein
MAAATDQNTSYGRIAVYADLAGIRVVISAVATVYSSAAGGLPIDLAPVLNQSGIFQVPYLRPEDVVDIVVPKQPTAGGFLIGGLTFGTPTYGPPVWPAGPAGSTNVRENNSLLTYPAWIRLIGIGAAATNHAALGEIADGAVTDTVTLIFLIARGGANIN